MYLVVVVTLASAYFLWRVPDNRQPGFLIGYGVVVALFLPEQRRALIFNENRLLYRPPLGRPLVLDFNRVKVAAQGTVVTFYLKPHFPTGVRFTLDDGKTIALPLDLRARREILDLIHSRLGDRAQF